MIIDIDNMIEVKNEGDDFSSKRLTLIELTRKDKTYCLARH